MTEPAEIHFRRMQILQKIRWMRIWMQICWCTIKVQPNTLVSFFKFKKKLIFIFLSFTLQQISTKDYDIVVCTHVLF